eukprot:CAMPEP_0177795378 /NCGR_PEP_ID=MMETSP0491_2-20121128/26199_1 /TAXON_ID=63592 /ORGANISM="Tetraselmis chuii, Strain PLY429" /LENGTH=240 /DNA_ID=CAMNT_0019318201 /DNA_START=127 /DNA_END=849 /DNA_ORIENTATION=+
MDNARNEAGSQPLLESGDDSGGGPQGPQAQAVESGARACKADDVELNVDMGDDSWNRDLFPVAVPAGLHSTMPGMIQAPYPAPQAVMHIPNLPDAALYWREQWGVMLAWLLLSSLLIVFDLFNLAFIGGVLGVVGASLHVCACCGGPELSGPVKSITVLAYISASFSALTFVILATVVIAVPAHCDEQSSVQCSDAGGVWIILDILLLLLHMGVSALVARRGHRMKKLLNPVTAGVVVLN